MSNRPGGSESDLDPEGHRLDRGAGAGGRQCPRPEGTDLDQGRPVGGEDHAQATAQSVADKGLRWEESRVSGHNTALRVRILTSGVS